MQRIKPVLILAMITALTACATSHSVDVEKKLASSNSDTAIIKLVKGYYGSADTKTGPFDSKTAYYVICETDGCETARSAEQITEDTIKFFPWRQKETDGAQVTSNKPIIIIAGLKFPQIIESEIRPYETRKECVRKLEFTPKAGKMYRVKLVEEKNQNCSLELSEV